MALSKDQIVAAALALADESGLEAVTMRAVAARVDASPMALYRHVADKEELLDGVLELVLSEVPLPEPSLPWDLRLLELAAGIRTVARCHPTTIGLVFSRPGDTPGVRKAVAVTIGALTEAGVPPSQLSRLERMLSTFVVGFALSEVSGRFPRDQQEDLGREFAANLLDMVGVVRSVAGTA
jgi:AcrR family transcriptional regulator